MRINIVSARAGRIAAVSALLPLTAVLAACAADSARADLEVPAPQPVSIVADAGAALPHVHGSEHGLLLSWVQPGDTGSVLLAAPFDDAGFGEPMEVARGADWFVNWADFPSVVRLGANDLAAHWLQRSGSGTYAYDVVVSRSADGGRTWSEPVRPHTDGTQTEHGFVTLFPVADGVGAVWLDGRRFAGDGHAPENEMTVRFTTVTDGPGEDVLIDERACDCCQTSVALTARGALLVYRDRSPEEVRDIAVSRLEGGRWSAPRPLHEDGWVIDACPVNGPQADAIGEHVAVAWFTAAQDTPRVLVTLSADAGDTFGAPIRVDAGDPIGRVDITLLDEMRALVVWLERTADGADVRGRIVTARGAGPERTLARTAAQRPSGFPRLGRHGDTVLLAWTVPGDSASLRTATLDFAR
jgi:hypothetical protein